MSFRRASIVPFGSAAKASSVGAKTVNGPSPFRVSVRFVALRAVRRVVKSPLSFATSTMVFVPSSCAEAIQVAALKNNRIIKARDKLLIPLI
ncbi:MAG: hypothetical protein ACYDEF_17510 [Methanosarcina sp.]|nr:hypothetical protein BGV40_17020 [Methanosarcina sp. Ant1]